MNAKTLLLNAVIGLVTGAAVLFFLREPGSCCCGAPAILILACLVGPALAPLFYGYTLKAGSAIGFGIVHGLLVGIAAVLVCGFGLFAFTSDDTVREKIDAWDKAFGKVLEKIEEQARKTEMSESDREKLKEFRKKRQDLTKLKEDPAAVRSVILTGITFAALILGVLAGLLGGWLGSLIFRDRLKPRPDAGPDDLLQMPEQPKQWWEEE